MRALATTKTFAFFYSFCVCICAALIVQNPDNTSALAATPTVLGAFSTPTIICTPIWRPTSDFACHAAFAQFVSTLNDNTRYPLVKVPKTSGSNILVPKRWRVGTCEFKVTVTDIVPPVALTGRELKDYGLQLMNKCVLDEAYSNGGWIEVGVRYPKWFPPWNSLRMTFKNTRDMRFGDTNDDVDEDEANQAWSSGGENATSGGIVKVVRDGGG